MSPELFSALSVLAERMLPIIAEGCRELLGEDGTLTVAGVCLRQLEARDDDPDGDRNAVAVFTYQASSNAMFVTVDQQIGLILEGETYAEQCANFCRSMRDDLKDGEVML